MRRHRQDLSPMTEMNVTNLLDTAFILLMAFMIVAPAIKHGIELELPTIGEAQSIDSKKTVTVVIQKAPDAQSSDAIYLEDRRVSLEQLQRELVEQKKLFPEMDVVVEGDTKAAYGTFVEAAATIMAAGIENVGLVAEPKREEEK